MRALITGGRGFVGHWLASHLEAAGDEVVITDTEVDVADLEAVSTSFAEHQPEAIYHLAALSHVGASWEDPSAVLRINVLGTAMVLAAARRLDPSPRVLVISSAEVYGQVRPVELPLTEESPLRPVSPYAGSKAAAEQLAIQAVLGFGQDVVIARPFNHIGPGQRPNFAVAALSSRIAEAVQQGATSMRVGNLSAARDFTDVRDVVAAYRCLVTSGDQGQVYNVCTGRAVEIGDVARQLCDLAGVSLDFEVDPALFRPVDVPVLCGSADRLFAATGWTPSIPLETTLTDVLAAHGIERH